MVWRVLPRPCDNEKQTTKYIHVYVHTTLYTTQLHVYTVLAFFECTRKLTKKYLEIKCTVRTQLAYHFISKYSIDAVFGK